MNNPCCVRGCESTQTQEHRIKRESTIGFGKTLTYVIRICKACREALIDKPIQTTYWQCGRLAFVDEIWEDSNETG